jgi:hypothetical protein
VRAEGGGIIATDDQIVVEGHDVEREGGMEREREREVRIDGEEKIIREGKLF